ncbi:MAG: hypothetical protein JSS69_12315 [Acidobacteria bacterium]|nr:hypothetical protein [Acidobacteriota bacterium]
MRNTKTKPIETGSRTATAVLRTGCFPGQKQMKKPAQPAKIVGKTARIIKLEKPWRTSRLSVYLKIRGLEYQPSCLEKLISTTPDKNRAWNASVGISDRQNLENRSIVFGAVSVCIKLPEYIYDADLT